jgi:hypothetical protein
VKHKKKEGNCESKSRTGKIEKGRKKEKKTLTEDNKKEVTEYQGSGT